MTDLALAVGVLALAGACIGNAYWNARHGRDVIRLERRVRELEASMWPLR